MEIRGVQFDTALAIGGVEFLVTADPGDVKELLNFFRVTVPAAVRGRSDDLPDGALKTLWASLEKMNAYFETT